MVHIPNEVATEAFETKKNGIDISREVYENICEWVEDIEFDDEDLFDFSRHRYFGEYEVSVEHFTDGPDDISVQTKTRIGFMLVPDFLDQG